MYIVAENMKIGEQPSSNTAELAIKQARYPRKGTA